MRIDLFWTVVARPNHDGVFAGTELVDGVQHLARAVVHLGQHVGVVAVPGFTVKVWVGQRR